MTHENLREALEEAKAAGYTVVEENYDGGELYPALDHYEVDFVAEEIREYAEVWGWDDADSTTRYHVATCWSLDSLEGMVW